MLDKISYRCFDLGLCIRRAYKFGTRIYCYVNKCKDVRSTGDVLVLDEGDNVDRFAVYINKYDSDKRINEVLLQLGVYVDNLEIKKYK
jgi:hypothetical protein